PLLESGAADILQPDLSHAGGISECRRIAAMAEAYDVAVAPHCPLSVIAFAACIQLDACTANAVFQEQSIGIHNCSRENPNMQWIQNPEVFAFSEGYVSLPKGPGLGIEPDEERIAAASETPHNWKNPLFWTDDGTPIEW
ncbi:MAG TPA: enolase C-terminal domain-like protein, partial [Clostridia bacterium]|nr:enolase C-terminal domain-like protein [Clostridia bacterium]